MLNRALAWVFAAGLATSAMPSSAHADVLPIEVQSETLDNGLRVILSPDHRVPTVGIAVYYDVGARVEARGRSGFAHLFEHMMFEGSASVAKGEHFRYVNLHGGDFNGTTSEDVTTYYESFPSYALELGLWLEADRMRSLDLSDEKLNNQRHAVADEKDESYDNAPYGLAQLRRDAIAYEGYWPYEHSVIGDMTELSHASTQEIRAFHQQYYAPNNAVLVVTGDLDPGLTMAAIRKHFGEIPRHPTTAWVDPGYTLPTQERRDTITDPLIDRPAFHLAWHIPSRRTPDHYALELLARILGAGESSRLYRALVMEREVASSISVDVEGRRGPDLFSMFCVLTGRRSAEQVRSQIDDIIRDVGRHVTRAELDRAIRGLKTERLFALQSNLERAQQLAEFEIFDGNAALLRTELDRYETVRVEDIRRVVQQYMIAEHRVVLDVEPKR